MYFISGYRKVIRTSIGPMVCQHKLASLFQSSFVVLDESIIEGRCKERARLHSKVVVNGKWAFGGHADVLKHETRIRVGLIIDVASEADAYVLD